MSKKAIILVSGGLDSTTTLVIARAQGYECYALSFDYGQRHFSELNAAKQVAKNFGAIEHKILSIPADEIRGSALTDMNIAVPDYSGQGKIPVTYVPSRNIIFLSFASAWAEVIGARDIFVGANTLDYSGYPDCRPDFLAAFEQAINIGTKAGVEEVPFKIHAPLITYTKAQIVKKGIELGIDYSLTISCYRADEQGRACRTCDSCTYRKKGFAEAGIDDPTLYV